MGAKGALVDVDNILFHDMSAGYMSFCEHSFKCTLMICIFLYTFFCIQGGTQKAQNLFIKNCVFFSHMFKLQSPSKYSVFDIFPIKTFFHCSKQFLNSSILRPFRAFTIFLLLFHLSTLAKCSPLRIFFSSGKEKKSLGERSGK